ncbi:mariner mos1 transposase [Plakobranchus ocellatus]|uniref:Mariner mos1 transposase n=1 Tax=Plakobranchus ocellatus TaxID=259542 RepID=A0AAV4CKD7_9GAST|nr:mariner mos1 transposase [Plakobranchus ocellatus]
MVTELMDKYEWFVFEHPRYSPHLASCNCRLFPKMKERPRGYGFELEDEIIFATKEVIIKNPMLPPLTVSYGECENALTMAWRLLRGAEHWMEIIYAKFMSYKEGKFAFGLDLEI